MCRGAQVTWFLPANEHPASTRLRLCCRHLLLCHLIPLDWSSSSVVYAEAPAATHKSISKSPGQSQREHQGCHACAADPSPLPPPIQGTELLEAVPALERPLQAACEVAHTPLQPQPTCPHLAAAPRPQPRAVSTQPWLKSSIQVSAPAGLQQPGRLVPPRVTQGVLLSGTRAAAWQRNGSCHTRIATFQEAAEALCTQG